MTRSPRRISSSAVPSARSNPRGVSGCNASSVHSFNSKNLWVGGSVTDQSLRAQVRHQLFNRLVITGVHRQSDQLFFAAQWLLYLQLLAHHTDIRIGGIQSLGLTPFQARFDQVHFAMTADDSDRDAKVVGQFDISVTGALADKGCIHDHRVTGFQGLSRGVIQVLKGASVHLGAVELQRMPLQAEIAVDAFALHVGTHTDHAYGFGQAFAEIALATAADTMHQEYRWLALAAVVSRELQIVTAGVQIRLQSQHGDFGAHHGAVGLVEVQQRQTQIVAGQLQVTVEAAVGPAELLVRLQVHQQERKVRDGIDPAEFQVELNAVEQAQMVMEQIDVGQVKVAVTFTYMPITLALPKAILQRAELLRNAGGQLLQQAPVIRSQVVRRDIAEVVGDHFPQGVGFAPGAILGHNRNFLMELGDLFGQQVDPVAFEQVTLQ